VLFNLDRFCNPNKLNILSGEMALNGLDDSEKLFHPLVPIQGDDQNISFIESVFQGFNYSVIFGWSFVDATGQSLG
jgi:hypothetical protein